MRAMSRFGIRSKVRGLVKQALGVDDVTPAAPYEPPSRPPSAPTPPSAAPASPPGDAAPVPPPAAEAAPPSAPSPAPTAAPATPPKPGPPSRAPTASLGAKKVEPTHEAGSMWVQAGKAHADEIVPGSVHQVEVFGRRYALYSVDGDLFATSDACPHAGGPLGEGDLSGHEITCPFHGFTFDVRSGACTSGADLSVDRHAVRIKKNRVLIEVPS